MYESFYGLSGKPFQLNPDPAFFYASKGHNSAHSFLKYGVYQGEGFIVITGDIGAGKTTVLRALMQELDPRKVVAAQLVSTQLEADDLVRSVAVAFGLPVKGLDKAQLLSTLEAFLASLTVDSKRALLVVDEAQNLAPRAMEELRMLSNFQLGDHALLQSFLVGQPELRDLLRAPDMQQLRQRIIASYHLGPMDAAETRGYVEHRLQHVDWKDDPSFDASAFEAIHIETGGIPRRINQLCNRLLLSAFLAEKHALTATDVEQVGGEIREEMGGVVSAATVPAPTLVGYDEGPKSDNVIRPFATSAITARLDRLEKLMNTMLELVRAQSGPLPERRGRSGRQAKGG
ncbi:MAG: XrtA/PEP-CTERM system-associated ATPase [Burkholderiaceae bacterium]|nr:XrtA/PEP-CTERM system-associated ATPase [Burkholderiaceae bacterium]